jgi:uncharacterized membrane protein YuzA (DUF378 family)
MSMVCLLLVGVAGVAAITVLFYFFSNRVS